MSISDEIEKRERRKLIARARRISGQMTGVLILVEDDADWRVTFNTLSACRGAITALMAEVLENHIAHRLISRDSPGDAPERLAAAQLVDIVKSYLR